MKKMKMMVEDFNELIQILAKYNMNSVDNSVVLMKALMKMGFKEISTGKVKE